MPIVGFNAERDDLLHLLGQTGRLLVPIERVNSWCMNADLLAVWPKLYKTVRPGVLAQIFSPTSSNVSSQVIFEYCMSPGQMTTGCVMRRWYRSQYLV